jgi:hypothetical protein
MQFLGNWLSYQKRLNLALRRHQTPSDMNAKIDTYHYVGDFNTGADSQSWIGTLQPYVKYNRTLTFF